MFTNQDEETRNQLQIHICVRDLFLPLPPEHVDVLHLVPLDDPPAAQAVVPVLPVRLGVFLNQQNKKNSISRKKLP